jgi:hypothetical protein
MEPLPGSAFTCHNTDVIKNKVSVCDLYHYTVILIIHFIIFILTVQILFDYVYY